MPAASTSLRLKQSETRRLPRRSFSEGGPKEIVQKIYGHSRADMTDRYCEYQTNQMRVALESVISEVVPFGRSKNRDMQGMS